VLVKKVISSKTSIYLMAEKVNLLKLKYLIKLVVEVHDKYRIT